MKIGSRVSKCHKLLECVNFKYPTPKVSLRKLLRILILDLCWILLLLLFLYSTIKCRIKALSCFVPCCIISDKYKHLICAKTVVNQLVFFAPFLTCYCYFPLRYCLRVPGYLWNCFTFTSPLVYFFILNKVTYRFLILPDQFLREWISILSMLVIFKILIFITFQILIQIQTYVWNLVLLVLMIETRPCSFLFFSLFLFFGFISR